MGFGAAALVYGAVTLLLFHNLLPGLATRLYPDLGDPLLNTAVLAWNAKRVPLTEPWCNFPSFAPLLGMTSLTEHLLLTYPVTTPVIWATGNPVLAYNDLPLASPRIRPCGSRTCRHCCSSACRSRFSTSTDTCAPADVGRSRCLQSGERVTRRGEFELYRLPELR